MTGYTDGTELRNTAFDVIRTYPLLRRAAWLDATHLVGYQSPVDYWSAGYTSAAVPVMVDVNSGETQESDMPFGVSGSPMSNGYGWTVVAKPVSRIEWNYVVWSPDAATRKREGAPNGWSNDGSKLAISHQSGMTHWPEVLSWPDDQTLYEDRTIGLSGTIDFDPSGNYVSFDMSTDEFATTHALRIVNLRSQAVEDIPLGESDAESFWTADGRLSVLDRDTLAVRVFDPDGTQVDSYVARFPDVWASDDGSSVAFFNEEDNTQIEVIRHGDASSVDAPATGWGSVYFSPDGSVMVFWQDRTREFLRKV